MPWHCLKVLKQFLDTQLIDLKCWNIFDLVFQVKGLPQNQGALYKEAVEDMFRICDPNPRAYFEETK